MVASLDLKVPNFQKTRRHNSFYVWTEAQFGLIFVAAQKLSDIVWTPLRYLTLYFREIGAAQLPSVTEIAPPEPFLCVKRSPIRYDIRGGAKAIRYSMNTSSIFDCPLKTSARSSFAPPQKTSRHNSFYVWTEAQSDMIFVTAQKLSSIVWTPLRYFALQFRHRSGAALLRHRKGAATTVFTCEQKPNSVWFSWRRKSYSI